MEDDPDVTIVVLEIYQFEQLYKSYKGEELLNLLDQLYNSLDSYCDQYGLQKIETVGERYMACGGLKSAEKKIDQRLLNKHHSVRATDFAMEV